MRRSFLLSTLLFSTLSLVAQETIVATAAPQPAPAPIQTVDPHSSTPIMLCGLGLEPLMLYLKDTWQEAEPKYKLEVQTVLATEVTKRFIEGQAHFAAMMREMKPGELKKFTDKWGYAPTRIAIAQDAMVFLTHKNNPVPAISIEKIDALWTTTKNLKHPTDITTWGELGLGGRNWKDRPVLCVDRPKGAGLRTFFEDAVAKGGKHKESNKESNDILNLMETLMSNQAALSYGGMGEIFNNLRAIPVVPIGGKDPVEPTRENVVNGKYPLARFIYVYINRAPRQSVAPSTEAFLRYVLGPKGQRDLEILDHIALSPDILAMNLKRLD